MLGERVRMVRDEAGLSREAFSERIGYKTGNSIQLVERNLRGLSDGALRELCRQFSVDEHFQKFDGGFFAGQNSMPGNTAS